MVGGHTSFSGFLELVALGPEAPPGSVGERLDLAFAGQERRQHGSRRDAGELRHHGREFQVRVLSDGW